MSGIPASFEPQFRSVRLLYLVFPAYKILAIFNSESLAWKLDEFCSTFGVFK